MKFKLAKIVVIYIAFYLIAYKCYAQEEPSQESTEHQRIYHFQHKLIPQWTHETHGHFFGDLSNGEIQQLLDFAAEIVSSDFSRGISVKTYPEHSGILITFPPPKEPPECYFIYIKRSIDGPNFNLYTYELTQDFFNMGSKGVVGSWSKDGGHGNFGPRTYEDEDSFVNEMQNNN